MTTIDHAQLPLVREAQGGLTKSIFDHPAFDVEGERMFGKLFYLFEETLAVNDQLEMAHLGEDANGSIESALKRSIAVNSLVCGSDPDAELLKQARAKFQDRAEPDQIADIDFGDNIRQQAELVIQAAHKVLGTSG